jgi:hypothetical protein
MRTLYHVGSILGLALVVVTVICGDWRLLPGVVMVGYGLAWIGHFVVEG